MAELSRRHLVVSGLAGAGASLLPGSIREANAAVVNAPLRVEPIAADDFGVGVLQLNLACLPCLHFGAGEHHPGFPTVE